jgi:hypothetical protein
VKDKLTIIDNTDHKTAIRQADRRGKKTVELDGVLFSIERKDRKVKYETTVFDKEDGKGTKKQVARVESWLVVRPADKRKTSPVAHIELKEGGNLRSQF